MSKMYGKVVVLKRDGQDGASFPMHTKSITIGRMPECDIRVQLPTVSRRHCRLSVNSNQQVLLTNLSSVNPVQLNGKTIKQEAPVYHADIVQVDDRFFRFEYPPNSVFMHIPKSADLKDFARKMIDVLNNQEEEDPIEENVLKTVKKPRKSMASFSYNSPEKFAPMNSGKRISFAAKAISPEIIDKNLPASQPVKRGSIPASPVPSKVRKSLLRTPGAYEPLKELNESKEGRSSSVGANYGSGKTNSETGGKSKSVSPSNKSARRPLIKDENINTLNASGIENTLTQRKIIKPHRRSRVSIRTDSPDSSLDSITVFLTPDGRTPASSKLVQASTKSKLRTPFVSAMKGAIETSPKDTKVPSPRSQRASPWNKRSALDQNVGSLAKTQMSVSPMTKKTLLARSSIAPTPRTTNMRVELLKKTLNKPAMVEPKGLIHVAPKSAKIAGRKSSLVDKKEIVAKKSGNASWADVAKKRLTPKRVVSKMIKGKRTFKLRAKPVKRNVVHQDMTPDLVTLKPTAVVKPMISSDEKKKTPVKGQQIPKVRSPGIQKLTKTTLVMQKAVLDSRKELIVRSLTSKTTDKPGVEMKSVSVAKPVRSPLHLNSSSQIGPMRGITGVRASLSKINEQNFPTLKTSATLANLPSAFLRRSASAAKISTPVKVEPIPRSQSSGKVKMVPNKQSSAGKKSVYVTVTPKRMYEVKTPSPKVVSSPQTRSTGKTPVTKRPLPKESSEKKIPLESEAKQLQVTNRTSLSKTPISTKNPSPRSRSSSKTPIKITTPSRLASAKKSPKTGTMPTETKRKSVSKSPAKQVTPVVKTEATPKLTPQNKLPVEPLKSATFSKSPVRVALTVKEEAPIAKTPGKGELVAVSSVEKLPSGRARSTSRTPSKSAEVVKFSSESKISAQQVEKIAGVRKSRSMSPKLDGMIKMLRTPKTVQSPRLSGIANLLKTPVVAAVEEAKNSAQELTSKNSATKATPPRSMKTRTKRGAQIKKQEVNGHAQEAKASPRKLTKRGATKSVEKEATPAKSLRVVSPVKSRTRKGRALKVIEPPAEKSPAKKIRFEKTLKSPAKESPKPMRATRGKKADASKEPITTPAKIEHVAKAKTSAKLKEPKVTEVVEVLTSSKRARRGRTAEEPVSGSPSKRIPVKKDPVSSKAQKPKTPTKKNAVKKSPAMKSPPVTEVVTAEAPMRNTRARRVKDRVASPAKNREKKKTPQGTKKEESAKKSKEAKLSAAEEATPKAGVVKTRTVRVKVQSPSPARSPVVVSTQAPAKLSRKNEESKVLAVEEPKTVLSPRKTRRGVKVSPKKAASLKNTSTAAAKSNKTTKMKASPVKKTAVVINSPPKTRSLRTRKK